MSIEMPEFRNCRGPNCHYKAPVCIPYGYCAVCCRKHHNYYVSGYLQNHTPPAFEPSQHGFKVIERGGPPVAKEEVKEVDQNEVSTPPECGSLEVVDKWEFPLEENAAGFYRSI